MKRFLAVLLVFALAFSMVPGVLATGTYAYPATLTDWWEVVLLSGLQRNLANYTAPSLSGGGVLDLSKQLTVAHIYGEDTTALKASLSAAQQGDGSFGGSVNNLIFAMLALDTAGGVYNTEGAVSALLLQQHADGGFSITGESDPDVSAQVILALSAHTDAAGVPAAISSCKAYLKAVLADDTASNLYYISRCNANTLATVISGLIAVGEALESDPAWKFSGRSIASYLYEFRRADGSYALFKGGVFNTLATAQGLIAESDLAAGSSVFTRLRISDGVPDDDTPGGGTTPSPDDGSYPAKTVSLIVGGFGGNILTRRNVLIAGGDEPVTGEKAFVTLLSAAGVSYTFTDSSFGKYLSEVAGETAGMNDYFGLVLNGADALSGLSDMLLEDGDVLEVSHIGLDTIVTFGSLSAVNGPVSVLIETSYFDWGTSGMVHEPLAGAELSIFGKKYQSGADGSIVVPLADVKSGSQEYLVTKLEGGIAVAPTVIGQVSVTLASGNGGTPVSRNIALYVKTDTTELFTGTIALEAGDTPITVLVRALGDSVKVRASGGVSYVYEIGGLREFAKGPASGWMYAIDGVYYKAAADSQILQGGEEVRWQYTTDLGEDLGEPTGGFISNTGEGTGTAADAQPIDLAPVYAALANESELSDFSIMALALAGKAPLERMQTQLLENFRSYENDFYKSTDLSRLIIASYLCSLNPYDMDGTDLVSALVNFEDIPAQGTNASAYGMLALLQVDAYGVQPLLDTLQTAILDNQNADGGFALSKGMASNPDVTAIALLALCRRGTADAAVTGKAWLYLQGAQSASGQFLFDGTETSESISQVILCMVAAGKEVPPILITALQGYQTADGFAHSKGGGTDPIATEQALLALAAVERTQVFTSVKLVKPPFADQALVPSYCDAARARALFLFDGDTDNNFNPKGNLTRAEAAKVFVRLLHLPPAEAAFADVPASAWYASFVGACTESGLFTGRSEQVFAPLDKITRQEMAVLLTRMLQLPAGELSEEVSDLSSASGYAKGSISAVFAAGLMVGDPDGSFRPADTITRAEFCTLLLRLL